MKNLCEFFREHAMKIISFKKKKKRLSTKEQQELYEDIKICYIYKEILENKYLKDKNIVKLEILVLIQWNMLRIAYVI